MATAMRFQHEATRQTYFLNCFRNHWHLTLILHSFKLIPHMLFQTIWHSVVKTSFKLLSSIQWKWMGTKTKNTILVQYIRLMPSVHKPSIDFLRGINRDNSPKNGNSVINYSPSCCSKPVRPLFIFGTQIKNFLKKSKSFLTLHRQQHNRQVQGPER